jgi:hypothetical protein
MAQTDTTHWNGGPNMSPEDKVFWARFAEVEINKAIEDAVDKVTELLPDDYVVFCHTDGQTIRIVDEKERNGIEVLYSLELSQGETDWLNRSISCSVGPFKGTVEGFIKHIKSSQIPSGPKVRAKKGRG